MMNNSSINFKDDTFGREPAHSLGMTFPNSNPFAPGIIDNSFPEKVNIPTNQSIRKVKIPLFHILY